MLEAVARALFKSWFVDFDPIRAMAEDGVPARLAACIAGRFPRRSQDGVPEGWQEQRLGDIADVNWGDTSKTKSSYTSEGYPAYSASGPDGFTSRYMFHNTGVVLSAIGANCGMTWLALGKWSCIKNTIRFWSTSPDVPTEFLFYATSGADKWPQRGSAQPFIAQHDARNVSVLIPTNNLATIFAEIVRPLHEKKDAAEQQNRTLAALRDTLLPKLISGELRVKDAERIIGRSLP